MAHFDDPAVRAVAALEDHLRRDMYAFIRQARRPVTRDEAAESVGISRKLAAFHLDKLVDAGVLTARCEAPAGVRKVGRTPKVYEPSDMDIQVSIPPREHDLLATILVDALLVDSRDSRDTRDAALTVAHDHGERIGAGERARARPGRLGAERTMTFAAEVLRQHGFEPTRVNPTCVRLRNCPFHPLAARAPELVCGINHALLTGLLAGLQASTVEAVLEPHTGQCCVELRRAEGD